MGCTHLILDVLLTRHELQRLASPQSVAAAMLHLHRPTCWPDRAAAPDCLVSCCCLRSCCPLPLSCCLDRLQVQLT